MMSVAECLAYVESHLEVRIATQNGAWRSGRKINPDGSVNHSVGCAQPSVDVFFNLMNKTSAGWGVNALLGDFHKGEGRIILALDMNTRPWGCGSGPKGSWNNSKIQWEVCEPAGHTYAGGTMIGYDVAKNTPYFERMWKMLVAWNVYCVVKLGYPQPAYDYCLKCSHTFNLLDARSAISVTERQSFVGRVRAMARECAAAYLKQREDMGYPLIKDKAMRDKLGMEVK